MGGSVKILLLDIETAPNKGYFWRVWKENIGIDQIIDSGYVMCWSAKWLGEKETMFDSCWDSGEKKMLRRMWKLLNEADVVVHYNGSDFDVPTLNKEFVKYGFHPPAPFFQVDLLQVVRKTFRFLSNKLEYVCRNLGLGSKLKHHGFELWVQAMGDDRKLKKSEIRLARGIMEKYNRHDVTLLERLYLRLRPWIRQHPSHGLFTDGKVCANCGSKHLQRRGSYPAKVLVYPRFSCMSCGAWMRGTKALSERRTKYVGV